MRLRPSQNVRHVPHYEADDNFYGTVELVRMLERAAGAVAARWPNSRLSVGELSARNGGVIPGHHSHRSGRDADISFYMRNAQGVSDGFWRFVSFDARGTARRTARKLFFDDERNWELVAHLLRDPSARVQYLFVAQPIRTRLLMEGRRRGEPGEFLRAAAAVLVEPKVGHKHANHFHLRIFCAQDDRPQCADSPPYWPWFDGDVPGGEYAELPAIHWRVPAANAAAPAAERTLGAARVAEHAPDRTLEM
jgi:penicillin-insensitive murein endopeptidase